MRENEFLKSISRVIWDNHPTESDFENDWKSVIDEFKLSENSWFSDIYDIRSSWIPVYFKDVNMGGLLRTTSRSESENSFFGRFLHGYMSLVEFYFGYNNAMEAQRNVRAKYDHETSTSLVKLITQLDIEKHAGEIFTHSIFKEMQKEIESAIYKCCIDDISTDQDMKLFTIRDTDKQNLRFQVSAFT